MDPIESALSVLKVFDWIGPTAAIIQDAWRGGGYTFLIPVECGWTGAEIINELRSNGVKTWGHMAINGTFTITVPHDQAEFAAYLLERAGLLIRAESE